MPEIGTYSLSGGRRPARKRASSDPTATQVSVSLAMSQDSIGVVTTGRGKLQEWKTTQKQNLSRKSRGTLTVVKWAGSRDKIFSPSGRGRTFFLTSLFIELIDTRQSAFARPGHLRCSTIPAMQPIRVRNKLRGHREFIPS